MLGALPRPIRDLWEPILEHVDLRLGQALYEPGAALSHVYFPTSAIVSLLHVTENGAPTQIGIVGDDGLVGVSVFMGGDVTTSRSVVLSAGQAFRLDARTLKNEFNRNGPLLHLLLRYTQALITQMAQTAVCNRHHLLDQQLCRWLLVILDRLDASDFVMTQELIASMLGVRREGITEAARKLQRDGVIKYVRGHITVLDRDALEKRSCECYEVVRREYTRLLPARIAT